MATDKHLRLVHPLAPPFGFEKRPLPQRLAPLEKNRSEPNLGSTVSTPRSTSESVLDELAKQKHAGAIYRRSNTEYGTFWGNGPKIVDYRHGPMAVSSQAFSKHLATTGMLRTRSLNTFPKPHRTFGHDAGGHRASDWTQKIG
mmetsp:Transcript_49232/g.86650  ORF Transcript_49232/g.86650 Transcript_49232/m.86650 type:complete len:143 (-) Transcript_49232:95-523(-)